MRRVFRALTVVTAYCLICVTPSHAADQLERVKAVFLFKFFDYVSWENKAKAPKRLCTFGHHPFGKDLIFIAKMRNSDKINIIDIDTLADAAKCHVLYIHHIDNNKPLNNIPNNAQTLIVSSDMSALKSGAMVLMEEKSGRVQLSINLKAAERKHLKISSRLLQISNVIR